MVEILKTDSANLSVDVKILLAILKAETEILEILKQDRRAYQRKKKNAVKHEPETPDNNDGK